MKLTRYTCLSALAVLLNSPLSYAESTDQRMQNTVSPAEDGVTQSQVPLADNEGKSASSDRTFPIWGNEARAQGYELPEPFGVNVSYLNMRQNIAVDSISFTGLEIVDFKPIPILPGINHQLPDNMFIIGVGNTRQKSESETLRLDMWVFPFLNLYGVLGKTNGNTLSKVSVDADPSQFSGFDKIIADAIHKMNQSGELSNIDFELKFKGTTYGMGTTLAGGQGNWFGLIDANYTQTRFDILDGSISALTVSPRIGYRFNLPACDAIHLGPSKLSVWVGSMYQNVQQDFRGSLSDLSLPPELVSLMAVANKKGLGRFEVKQHLESPVNILVGAQYEITKNFNVLTEFGFSDRNSFFVSGEYRF